MKVQVRSAVDHPINQCGILFGLPFETYDLPASEVSWLRQYAGVVVLDVIDEPAPEAPKSIAPAALGGRKSKASE